MLYGKPVQCLGGTADTSFLSVMLQLNAPQVPTTIATLARQMDRFSCLDLVEARRELDADSHWTLVQSITHGGPKLSQDANLRLIWPKSSKAKEPLSALHLDTPPGFRPWATKGEDLKKIWGPPGRVALPEPSADEVEALVAEYERLSGHTS